MIARRSRDARRHDAGRWLGRACATVLIGLARLGLRTVARWHRSGYLDLAQVERAVRFSAKLRGLAARMVGVKPRHARSDVIPQTGRLGLAGPRPELPIAGPDL